MVDSTAETRKHIDYVRYYMGTAVNILVQRGHEHDASKLVSPEKEAFDLVTQDLKDTQYGSDEYRANLDKIRPAIQHHYEHNDHHAEYYPNGIKGMSLFAMIEMLCDWKAASFRTKNGNFENSFAYCVIRYDIDDDLAAILRKTAQELCLFD